MGALEAAVRDTPLSEPPATRDEINAVLVGLRLATAHRSESDEEQVGRARMLASSMKGLPASVIKAACAAYVRDNRWFPLPADLKPFLDEAVRNGPDSVNRRRWARLKSLLELAIEERRREEIAANPVDPDAIAALIRRLGGSAEA